MRLHCSQRRLAALLVLTVGLPMGRAAVRRQNPEPARQAAWERLVPPSPESEWIFETVVDADGTPWILRNDGLLYWDGARFARPAGMSERAMFHDGRQCLYGGPDRGAYFMWTGDSKPGIFRLARGRLHRIAAIAQGSGYSSRLYVSDSGRVFWGARKRLAIHAGKRWRQWPATLDEATRVVDAGDRVLLESRGVPHAFDVATDRTPRPISWPDIGRRSRRFRAGCVWGEDRMIVARPASAPGDDAVKLMVWDSACGEQDLRDQVRVPFADSAVLDLFRTPDGSAWVITSDSATGVYEFHRIAPDATVTRVARSDRFGWSRWRLAEHPKAVLSASDGTIWLAMPTGGVARIAGGHVRVYGWRDGLPFAVRRLFEGRRGTIHAGAPTGIHVFRANGAANPLPAGFAAWDSFPSDAAPPIPGNDRHTPNGWGDGTWIRRLGQWTRRHSLVRSFAGREFECRFDDTPLAGAEHHVHAARADGNGDLWFTVKGSPEDNDAVIYVKRLADFRIEVGPTPRDVGRSFEITAKPVLPGLAQRDLRLFARLPGGPWAGGEAGASVSIALPAAGEHEVEVVGMDRIGGLSRPARLRVRAVVDYPDTKVTSPGPYAVSDVTWELPVEAVPSRPGRRASLVARVDAGAWQAIGPDKRLVVGRLTPGAHVVEVAAQERGVYRDPSPLELRIDYRPEGAVVLDARLDGLADMTPEQVCRAVEEIKLLGPTVVPLLKARLATTKDPGGRVSGLIKTLIVQLEDGGPAAE